MATDIVELVWQELQRQIDATRTQVQDVAVRYERAEVSENVPASTLAAAPLAADGGLADGVNFVTLRWMNDARKPTEGAGAGTGVLCVYDSTSDSWLRVGDYTPAVT